MAYQPPAYVRAVDSRDPHLAFEWDDWSDEEEAIEKDFYARLKGISHRACGAFAIATAEWILYRFSALENEPVLGDFIESAWAQLVALQYGSAWQEIADDDDWVGPVRGPIHNTLMWISDGIADALEGANPMLFTAWAASLAQIVLPDAEPYRAWRKRVMERLEALYPRDPIDSLGDVVPREALDPDADFSVEDTERLINHFLALLRPDENPYLAAPEKMLEEGFAGIPYAFSLEADRDARF
jgi:hypothetical protein